MIKIKENKDVFIFIFVFITGLILSIAVQNSRISENKSQKKYEFESRISNLTIIISDSIRNKKLNLSLLSESVSELARLSTFPNSEFIKSTRQLTKTNDTYESFFIFYEDENGAHLKIDVTNQESNYQTNLTTEIISTLLNNEGDPKGQFVAIGKHVHNEKRSVCLSTKIPGKKRRFLVNCTSLDQLFSNVISRSSRDSQYTYLYTGNRLVGYRHLYSYPGHTEYSSSLESLLAEHKNVVLLPNAIEFADQQVSIAFDPGNEYYRLDNWVDYLPFVFGLTLTLVLLYYIRSQSLEADRINHRVKLKTQELEEAKGLLENQVGKSNALFDQLQESNRELTALTNTIDGILWEGDPNTMGYTYISEQAERILGYSPESLLNGEFIIGSLNEGEKSNAITDIILDSPNDTDNLQVEFQGKKSTNEGIWIKGVITKVFKNRKLHRLRGVYIDISKQKNQEIKNKEIELKLRQAQKLESIGQLAAGIAHEINTPAQFVGDNIAFIESSCSELVDYVNSSIDSTKGSEVNKTLLELLDNIDFEFLKEELPDAIKQSRDGVDRISTIVGAMKTFSHPGREEKQKIDLNKAIESTAIVSNNEWKYLAEMEFDFSKDLPLLLCNPGELNQVFLNIIVNSAHAIEERYGAKSMGKIKIRTAKSDSDIMVSISDDGIGIPEEVIDKVFDPFFTTKDVGKGTGQGLAISYSVVRDKHNGTITIESVAGEGTVFHIRLPIEK